MKVFMLFEFNLAERVRNAAENRAKSFLYLNPFYRLSDSISISGGTTTFQILGRTIQLSQTAIQLIVAFLILVGLFLVRGLMSGVLTGLTTRGLPGSNKPIGSMSAVFMRLITEDIARIANILGQSIGAVAVTIFGYLILFLGIRGSLGRPRKVR